MEWFKSLETELQVALISGGAVVVAAIITGIFSLLKRENSNSSVSIKQSSSGSKNTFIGIQNNERSKKHK